MSEVDCSVKVIKVQVSHCHISVDPPVVRINRLRGESVRWEIEGGDHVSVFFSTGRSPFLNHVFHCGKFESGTVLASADSGIHKYSIESNGLLLDPIIMVVPPDPPSSGGSGH